MMNFEWMAPSAAAKLLLLTLLIRRKSSLCEVIISPCCCAAVDNALFMTNTDHSLSFRDLCRRCIDYHIVKNF